jgi:hypothetical protein
MKTIRLQVEELLLQGSSLAREKSGHPALNEAAEIETAIRALMSEDTSSNPRRLLLDIGGLSLKAFARGGVSREDIALNPATCPLICLLLVFLDRYCDGLRGQKDRRSVAFWQMVASALFLVQPMRGRPGPYSFAQKAELKTAYASARNRAVSLGKGEMEAHQLGLVAAYRSVRLEPGTAAGRFKENRVQVQRILKHSGLCEGIRSMRRRPKGR